MSVKAVQLANAETKRNYNNNQQKHNNVSFGNAGNPVITLMDAIDRGGFAASFIMQDFLGMAGPRVLTGMYRNHDKTGQLNWDFAKKEGIREILSGPSAFLIPAAMMFGIKKVSGTANNVPVDFINGFGHTFAEYAKANKATLSDAAKTKLGFYEEVFKNMLSASTNKGLAGEELDKTAKEFAQRLIEAEKAPKKSFWKHLTGKHVKGSAQDLQHELMEDFVTRRKQFLGAEGDKVIAEYGVPNDKKIASSFKSMLKHMEDYSHDAIKSVNKQLKKAQNADVDEIVKTLSKRRTGTRFLSNIGMWLAVVGFYTIIPKLYNHVTKGRDPGLDGLGVQDENVKKSANPTFSNEKEVTDGKKDDKAADKNAQPSFTGIQSSMAKLGKTVVDTPAVKKFSNAFEFDGATMSMPAMLTLLFGFCLPPRLIHAQSSTDRKEILMRDITSFLAILFGSKAINRVSSDIFAKESGLALNIKPANHNDNIFKKIWHYIYPTGGVQVLDSDRIVSTYSDVSSFKNGINDMFRFVDKNGGNVGKMLGIDKDIKAAASEILGKAPDKRMNLNEIIKAFDKAKDTDAYKKIVDILADKGNTIVKRAKTYNSAFGFASTVLLVPALMIWISKHCEKMTKQHIAEQKKASMENMAKQTQVPDSMRVVTNKPTMAGFLNRA